MSIEKSIQSLLDAATTDNHRHRLSEMMMSFLRDPLNQNPEHAEEVYLTFLLINNLLKDIDPKPPE